MSYFHFFSYLVLSVRDVRALFRSRPLAVSFTKGRSVICNQMVLANFRALAHNRSAPPAGLASSVRVLVVCAGRAAPLRRAARALAADIYPRLTAAAMQVCVFNFLYVYPCAHACLRPFAL